MPDDIVTILTHVRVTIITFALHTTHIFQMLDIVLFGALQKHATGLEKSDEAKLPPHSCSRCIMSSDRL
jgi:hypothetical protein